MLPKLVEYLLGELQRIDNSELHSQKIEGVQMGEDMPKSL
jgi:hypothetical protein